jgi:carbonic anhydrase/acetyltransferase-like protein (isoleucine patch superfamily)
MGALPFHAVPRCRAQVGVMVTRALLVIEETSPFLVAQVDVLGASLVERTAQALLTAGVAEVCVVGPKDAEMAETAPSRIRYVKTTPSELWNRARSAFDGIAASDAVLLLRMSSYCEIVWSRLLAQHYRGEERVTRAWATASEPLDVFVADPRYRKDIDYLFNSELRHTRMPAGRYQVDESEYVHLLQTPADLREIAADALHLRCRMRPVGREVRPGVWMAERSRVDEAVRLVAPVYIGKYARVRTGAVITRGSAVERHCSVDCGSVIEEASLLPYTTVGAGLDVVKSVVGLRHVADLKRDVVVEIQDPTLVNEVAHSAGVRVLAKAAGLITYLPLHFWKGVTGGDAIPELTNNEVCEDFSSTVFKENVPAPRALRPELVMERYGNQ